MWNNDRCLHRVRLGMKASSGAECVWVGQGSPRWRMCTSHVFVCIGVNLLLMWGAGWTWLDCVCVCVFKLKACRCACVFVCEMTYLHGEEGSGSEEGQSVGAAGWGWWSAWLLGRCHLWPTASSAASASYPLRLGKGGVCGKKERRECKKNRVRM